VFLEMSLLTWEGLFVRCSDVVVDSRLFLVSWIGKGLIVV
jgi:hypothetical protein